MEGSSRIRGKRRVEGNQTILVWHASASNGRHIRDMKPELEALVTLTAPHKSAMNRMESSKGSIQGLLRFGTHIDYEK